MVTALNLLPKPTALRAALVGLLLTCSLQAQANEPLTITIARGDTLIKLCERYLREPGQWPQIKRLNRISKDKRLQPGSACAFRLRYCAGPSGRQKWSTCRAW